MQIPELDLSTAGTGLLVRALRPAWLEHLADVDDELVGLIPSKFQRAWLSQLFTSGLAARASLNGGSLDEALETLGNAELTALLVGAANEIFGADPPDDEDGAQQPDRLLADVIRDASDGRVLDWLTRHGSVLFHPVDQLEWSRWIHERYLATIGTAVIQAAQLLCPENDASDLRLEVSVDENNEASNGHFLILEDEPGGSGLIEVLVDRYVDDPRAFWSLVGASLQEGDQERVDQALRGFLTGLQSPELRVAADRVRVASGLGALTTSWQELRNAMFRHGLPTDTSVVGAVATRVLRPGSGPATEALLVELLSRWDALEEAFGIELELRVFAYIASQQLDVVRQLDAIVVSGSRSRNWAFSQIVGLLWSRGARLRAAALQTYNPYSALPSTERLLAATLATPAARRITLPSAEWRGELDLALTADGSAILCAVDETILGDALTELVVAPTYLDALETHPRIGGVVRSSNGLEVLIELREIVQ